MTDLLEVTSLTAGYGDGPAILDGAHLNVEPGKVHCIIGPNGALRHAEDPRGRRAI